MANYEVQLEILSKETFFMQASDKLDSSKHSKKDKRGTSAPNLAPIPDCSSQEEGLQQPKGLEVKKKQNSTPTMSKQQTAIVELEKDNQNAIQYQCQSLRPRLSAVAGASRPELAQVFECQTVEEASDTNAPDY